MVLLDVKCAKRLVKTALVGDMAASAGGVMSAMHAGRAPSSGGRMRIIITEVNYNNDLGVYKGRQVEIESWFCEQEGIKAREACLARMTDRAILLSIRGKEHWIPLSLITWVERKEKGLDCFGD